MVSLVGLKAVDIASKLGREGSFEISSYNIPICTVIPVLGSCYDLVDIFYQLTKRLNCTDYTVIKKPRSREELIKLYRELEGELKNETQDG